MLSTVRNAIELLKHVSCDRCGSCSALLALFSALYGSSEVSSGAVLHHKVVDWACFIVFHQTDDVEMIQGRQDGRFLAKQLYLLLVVGSSFLDRFNSHQLVVSPFWDHNY